MSERQYLDDEQARHLYHNDQTFRQLVDCMVMLIRQLRLTPGYARTGQHMRDGRRTPARKPRCG